MTKLPANLNRNVVSLDPRLALRDVVLGEDIGIAIIHIEADRYVVLLLGALRDAIRALQSALNRSLANELLGVPLRDLFAQLAYPATALSNLAGGKTSWGAKPDQPGCIVVIDDGRIVGVLGVPAENTADALFQRIGVDPQRLNHELAMAESPEMGGESSNESEPAAKGLVIDSVSVAPPTPRSGRVREAIRLDVATPETAVVNETFDVAVAIRQPSSPPLQVDDLTQLSSTEGAVFRASDVEIVRYRVEIEAKDCDVEPESYTFLLEKGTDSLVQFFQITPRREGNISIVVNAYQADDNTLAATTRVRLKAVVQVVAASTAVTDATDTAMTITSTSTFLASAVRELLVKLYDTLRSDKFSLDDLQDIAFRLGVPWDELSGDTQSTKARSLVRYMQQRNVLADLQAAVREARPGLEV